MIGPGCRSQSFTFNPQCCVPLTTSSASSLLKSTSHNTLQAYQAQQQMEYASSIDWSLHGGSSIGGGTANSSSCKQMLIYNTLLGHNDALSSSAIVPDAAQGKIQAVRDALNKNPQLVKNSILTSFFSFIFLFRLRVVRVINQH
jgi:hypothetical protein